VVAILGRTEYYRANVVSTPPVLPGLGWGTLSVTEAFEQHPTASIEMRGIPASELAVIRNAYKLDTRYEIMGIPFVVASYGDVRYPIPPSFRDKTGLSEAYKAQVSFEGIWRVPLEQNVRVRALLSSGSAIIYNDSDIAQIQTKAIAEQVNLPYFGASRLVYFSQNVGFDETMNLSGVIEEVARLSNSYLRYSEKKGVTLVPFRQGKLWQFLEDQITDEGNTVLELPPAYNQVVLTWGNNTGNEQPPQYGDIPVADTPVQMTLTEEDDNCESPPKGTKVLKGIDNNADLSGPTKTRRVQTLINGTTVQEETSVYGFAYNAAHILNEDEQLESEEPQKHWKLIDYLKTSHDYTEPQGSLSFPATAENPTTGERLPVYFDLNQPAIQAGFVKVGGNTVTVNSSAKYLTKSTSEGYQIARYIKESSDKLESLEAFYNPPPRGSAEAEVAKLYHFFQLSVSGESIYKLEPERKYYADVAVPYSAQLSEYKGLPASTKQRITSGYVSSDGYVATGTVEAGFVESFLVLQETRTEDSFSYVKNPLIKEDPEITPRHYSVGKESYFEAIRSILQPAVGGNGKVPPGVGEKYSEKTKEFTAQDPNFDTSLTIDKTREVAGRPPQAGSIQTTYSSRADTSGLGPKAVSEIDLTIRVSSDLQNRITPLGGSLNFPNAFSLADALGAVKCTLNVAHLKTAPKNVKLSWYYPNLRSGDYVDLRGVRYRVIQVSHTLNYSGNNNSVGKPLCTSEGMDLQLAPVIDRKVFVNEQPSGAPKFLGLTNFGTLGGMSFPFAGLSGGQTGRRNF
jgi:hypothetical protein